MGVFGACRREELTFLQIGNIEDKNSYIKILIPLTKTKIVREFAITEGNINGISCLNIFRKYARLRPPNTTHDRFFVFYKNGKCRSQPVGINTFGSIPKIIATCLGLLNPDQYTGHCFRRTSASLLADAGADIQTVMRHGGWKSASVAEGYVENSTETKKKIAKQIFGDEINIENSTTSAISCVATSSAGLQISNCKKFTVNIHYK